MAGSKSTYKLRWIPIIWIVMAGFRCSVVSSSDKMHKDWMQNILPSDYQTYWHPTQIGRHPKSGKTAIHTELTPNSIVSVEPKTMDFAVHLQIKFYWLEKRLNITREMKQTTTTVTDVPSEIVSRLWLPNIVFANCKSYDFPLTRKRESIQLALLTKKISVTQSSTFVFDCDINLSTYPFDTQRCKIVVVKRGTDRRYVFLSIEQNLMFDPKIVKVPPDYRLTMIKTSNCTNSSLFLVECFEYVFYLSRQVNHHVMLVFIPSMLIVILSWISFWLDPEVAAPRVALGLTSLLTLATQLNTAQKDLPPVANVKAIDIWMFACIFLVFSSLIEFAISNYCLRKHKSKKVSDQPLIVRRWTEDSKSKPPQRTLPANKEVSRVDMFARIFFPGLFAVFNLCFWIYYVSQKLT